MTALMPRVLHIMDEQKQNPPQHIAERMAEVIVKQILQHGQCSIMDIKAMGFSLNDIARYWPEACRIAERKRPRTM